MSSEDGFSGWCLRSRTVADELQKRRSIDESDVASLGELYRLARELAGGDHKASGRAVCGHHAVKLAHDGDSHFEGLPLLALHQELVAVLAQDEIDPTVGATATRLSDGVATLPKTFADQNLKLAPSHSF